MYKGSHSKQIGKPSRCARHAGRTGGPKHVGKQLSQVRTPECFMEETLGSNGSYLVVSYEVIDGRTINSIMT